MKRPRPRKRRLLVLPLHRLFPNIVTLGGLCFGLTAMRFALESKFETAVALIIAAALFDCMDGRLARLLNSTSLFGAQLDSLSDFVCFGVSPMFVLYLWKFQFLKETGWALVLFFSVCCVLRLARFNTDLSQDAREPWQERFFVGIPSTIGGMLVLLPLVISFYAPGVMFANPIPYAMWVALVGIMMASRVPTFAAKKVRIHHEWILPIMLICGATMVMALIEPWPTFTFFGLLYCSTIPMSIRRYRRLAKIHGGSNATSAITPTVSSL